MKVRPFSLSFGLVILTLAAAGVVAIGALPNRDRQIRKQEFQHLLGGLGSGPSVDLSRCPFSFDARLACGCHADQGPIAGGVFFCPEHGCSILYCSPVIRNQR